MDFLRPDELLPTSYYTGICIEAPQTRPRTAVPSLTPSTIFFLQTERLPSEQLGSGVRSEEQMLTRPGPPIRVILGFAC